MLVSHISLKVAMIPIIEILHRLQLSCWRVTWYLAHRPFSCGIIPSEQKVHPVAFLVSPRHFKSSNSALIAISTPTGINLNIGIKCYRNLNSNPHGRWGLVTASQWVYCDGHHISLRYSLRGAQYTRRTCQLTIAAYDVIDVLPSHLFHISLYLSRESMYPPKQMVVAYFIGPLPSVTTASSALHRQVSMETFESLDHSALRNKRSTNCEAEHNTAFNEALQAKHDNSQTFVRAIRFKPRTDQES